MENEESLLFLRAFDGKIRYGLSVRALLCGLQQLNSPEALALTLQLNSLPGHGSNFLEVCND